MRTTSLLPFIACTLLLPAVTAAQSGPATRGDPHVTTVDGTHYDFQAAGEFVFLRAAGFRVQLRQAAVSSTGPMGPDPYTGLTTCVSVNSAIALRVDGSRVTYQPGPAGLELRIDGMPTPLPSGSLALTGGGRIDATTAPGGIRVVAVDDRQAIVTPGWWDHVGLWYLHVAFRNVAAAEGIAGAMPGGSWLPALPGGAGIGPRPASLQDRYDDLYASLGVAWRVTDGTTLFDYPGGTTPSDFLFPGWPGGESPASCDAPPQPGGGMPPPPQPPLSRAGAEQLCAGLSDDVVREHCIQDVMVTGEAGFAQTYLREQDVLDPPGPITPLPPVFEP